MSSRITRNHWRTTGSPSTETRGAFSRYIGLRRGQPHFANARSIRNALDRARLRQAKRLFEDADGPVTAADLMTLAPPDILASRVFAGGLDSEQRA